MERKTLKSTLVVAAVAVAITGGYVIFDESATSAHAFTPSLPTAATAVTSASLTLPDFSSIVAQNGAAVVNVSVTGPMKTAAEMTPFPQLEPNDPFFEFFRRFRPQVPQQGSMPVHGLGSGFIVSPDGVILTNAHVVDDGGDITVKLTDKREFKAKVIGVDKPTDVAVLKIDAKNLPIVRLGDPSQARVGTWVVAIGAPFGFENSVTAGIISAKSRSLPDEGYVSFIQTDVAVNPGNSGGPLFNLSGEVIGINSQIYSRTGGYQGLSFAIPIDIAMKVEQQIVQHGKVSRGRAGVMVQEVTQSLADSFGLKRPVGALVSSVEKDSPGEKAGLQPGDVILKFNGKEVVSAADLPPQVADIKPGSSVKMEIWRKGHAMENTLTIGEFEDPKLAASNSNTMAKGRLGLAVRPLTPDEQRQAEVSGGILVEDAVGPAARAGIQRGDVILSFNGEPIASIEQLRALASKAGKQVALLVQRDNAKIFVPVTLG